MNSKENKNLLVISSRSSVNHGANSASCVASCSLTSICKVYLLSY